MTLALMDAWQMRDSDVLVTACEGSVSFAGQPITGKEPDWVARSGIAHVPEGREIFPFMTVKGNLMMGAYARRDKDGVERDLEMVYGYFPILRERANSAAGYLSGGQQQMLAIGRALMTNPRLLILDEPTEGLAPLIRSEIWRCLARLRSEGQAVLLIDKNVAALTRLADRHYLIERGRVVWTGTSKELTAAADIQHRYLGV